MSKPTFEEVHDDIRQQLHELTGTALEDIHDDDYLVENLGATSLAMLQIYVNCQDKYGIHLSEDINLIEPLTVAGVCNKILAKIEENENAA